MRNLSSEELTNIKGGVDPITIATLVIAVAGVYVQILDHCYNVGKD